MDDGQKVIIIAHPEQSSGELKSEGPDQMPHSAATDQGLHCLPMACFGVLSIIWVNASKVLYFLQDVISVLFKTRGP